MTTPSPPDSDPITRLLIACKHSERGINADYLFVTEFEEHMDPTPESPPPGQDGLVDAKRINKAYWETLQLHKTELQAHTRGEATHSSLDSVVSSMHAYCNDYTDAIRSCFLDAHKAENYVYALTVIAEIHGLMACLTHVSKYAEDSQQHLGLAEECYAKAHSHAIKDLPGTNPHRLAVSYSYAGFMKRRAINTPLESKIILGTALEAAAKDFRSDPETRLLPESKELLKKSFKEVESLGGYADLEPLHISSLRSFLSKTD